MINYYYSNILKHSRYLLGTGSENYLFLFKEYNTAIYLSFFFLNERLYKNMHFTKKMYRLKLKIKSLPDECRNNVKDCFTNLSFNIKNYLPLMTSFSFGSIEKNYNRLTDNRVPMLGFSLYLNFN